ncbi:hypothetical protein B8A39_05655 [Dolosigranulum pigrum]|uniref:hypothetical protein n=1 Tax=Dolosigranulum pigrum TaxID=29394 RepID=UPI000DBFC319|nr:hypothetical protein [Dolosigranulum pigrum]QTJ51782.1 hypothetical protein FE332_04655 [Dolosigranulum pigrum]RAN51690.1 hypothetical protein B8A39_05655 [Dolosigranulum pigrum]
MEHLAMDLLVFIVNEHESKQLMIDARQRGVAGGTIIPAEGTIKNGFLRKLCLDSVRREICLILTPTAMATKVLDHIARTKQMHKKHHGIGAQLPLNNVLGLSNRQKERKTPLKQTERESQSMYQAIFTVVERGTAQEVMTVAEERGATGGTIIHGRGASSKDITTVFNMEIEPEKDILLIITATAQAPSIMNGIADHLNIEQENSGVMFTLDISELRGIYE